MPTPAVNASARPIHESAAVPGFLARPLAASERVGYGQFVTVAVATGLAALNDGTMPGQISGGVGDPSTLSDQSAVAGEAFVRLSQRHLEGIPASSAANDGFTDADFCVPFWIANENTPGKLSNLGGDNRSMGGLVFGLGDDGNPILWTGPVAHLMARAAHQLDAKSSAWFAIADAAANAATAERAIPREALHGTVVGIEFIGAAVAANDTNYATITVSKRDGAGGAAVVLGTYDTRAANEGAISAFEPAAFTLSAVAGALDLLETDIVTITVTKAATGQTLTGAVRLIQKVI